MNDDKVLVIPGDGPERTCIEYAAELLSLMAPGIELEWAEFGRAAMEEYNDVLPASTEDAVADARMILCGRADMTGLKKKDPLKTIMEYNNVTARAVEFFYLPYMPPKSRRMEGCIVTPVLMSHQIREADALDEVETTYVTVDEDESAFFKLCANLAKKRGRGTVIYISSNEALPLSSKLSEARFKDVMKKADIEPVCYDTVNGFNYFTANADTAGMMVGGAFSALPLLGAAYGMSGGVGLMADTFIGNNVSIYAIPENTPDKRRSNPTSAFSAVANILNDAGYTLESKQVIDAITEVYNKRYVTPDVRGSKTPLEVFTELVEIINTQI